MSTLCSINILHREQLHLPRLSLFVFCHSGYLSCFHNNVLEHLIKLIFLLCKKILPSIAVSCFFSTIYSGEALHGCLVLTCGDTNCVCLVHLAPMITLKSLQIWQEKKKGRCSKSPHWYAFQMFKNLSNFLKSTHTLAHVSRRNGRKGVLFPSPQAKTITQ